MSRYAWGPVLRFLLQDTWAGKVQWQLSPGTDEDFWLADHRGSWAYGLTRTSAGIQVRSDFSVFAATIDAKDTESAELLGELYAAAEGQVTARGKRQAE